LFNTAREAEYGDLKKALQNIISRRRKRDAESAVGELERLTRQFRELQQIDFFNSARGH